MEDAILDKFKSLSEKSSTIIISSLPTHTGGKFLTSLLDGHPELIVMPFTVHRYANFDLLPKLDWEKAFNLANIDTEFQKIFKILDLNLFYKNYLAISKKIQFSPKNFLFLISFLVYFLLGKKFTENSKFVFHTHDFYRTSKYIDWFDNPKIIFISRHPYNMFAGYIKKLRRSSFTNPAYDNLIRPYRYIDVLNYLHSITLELKRNAGVVILEQLHAQPEKSLKQLSKYIEINYNESLLKSTQFGQNWIYDGAQGKVSGFGDQHKNLKLDLLGNDCLNCFNSNLQNHLKFFGYEEKKNLKYSKLKCVFDKTFFNWYLDFFRSLTLFWGRKFSFKYKILVTAKYLLKNVLTYPIIKFIDVFYYLEKIKIRDNQSKYLNVIIVNPLEENSMTKK